MPLLQSYFPCEAGLSTVASSRNWLRARARCGNTSVSQPMLMARSWTKRSYVDCARRSIIAYSGNASNHLQRAHSQELAELRGDSDNKPGPSVLPTARQPSSKQQSLPGIVERSIAFPQDSAKHKRLVDATADFICQGLLPLKVVNERSFRRLLEIAEPSLLTSHNCITVAQLFLVWFPDSSCMGSPCPYRKGLGTKLGCSIVAALQFHL